MQKREDKNDSERRRKRVRHPVGEEHSGEHSKKVDGGLLVALLGGEISDAEPRDAEVAGERAAGRAARDAGDGEEERREAAQIHEVLAARVVAEDLDHKPDVVGHVRGEAPALRVVIEIRRDDGREENAPDHARAVAQQPTQRTTERRCGGIADADALEHGACCEGAGDCGAERLKRVVDLVLQVILRHRLGEAGRQERRFDGAQRPRKDGGSFGRSEAAFEGNRSGLAMLRMIIMLRFPFFLNFSARFNDE